MVSLPAHPLTPFPRGWYLASYSDELKVGEVKPLQLFGRDVVLFCGYHGWHDWYLAANLSEDASLNSHLFPGIEPVGVPKAEETTAKAATTSVCVCFLMRRWF